MDTRYYEILRQAAQDDYYNAINDPEDELYNIVWDLFEKLVIEPAEVFDIDFQDNNQFRYSINSATVLEFFPREDYYRKRIESNPYRDDSDAAGVHLQFSILPSGSCLFSVGFQIWGAPERQALKSLWRNHRKLLSDLLLKSKPMVSTRVPFAEIQQSYSLEETLDNYLVLKDPENFIALRYPFARSDEADIAQNFMVTMALLFHCIRSCCRSKTDEVEERFGQMKHFYSGHIPELPAPLPSVDLSIVADAE